MMLPCYGRILVRQLHVSPGVHVRPGILPRLTAVVLGLGLLPTALAADVPRILLDVDQCEDVDDAGAVATRHALANRGEAKILGILISSKNEWVGPFLDAINSLCSATRTTWATWFTAVGPTATS